MTRRLSVLLLLAAACGGAADSGTDAAAAGITAEGLMAHINVLASDAYEGRGPGTPGEDSTVRYLTDTFKAIGLAPGTAADRPPSWRAV